MVSAAKLKTKIETKVLNKLGSTLTIKEYTFTAVDKYNRITETLTSTSTVKAVEGNSEMYGLFDLKTINAEKGDLSLFLPADTVVKGDSNTRYEFTWYGNIYLLDEETYLGRIQDISTAVVKLISLKLKQ